MNHLGNRLSHDHSDSSPWRRKRSLRGDQSRDQPSDASHFPDGQSDEALHYHIDSTSGTRLRLLLRPNRELVSEKFRVHLRRDVVTNGTRTRSTESWIFNDTCVFVGSVVNHTDSSVAVNVCEGMVSTGYILLCRYGYSIIRSKQYLDFMMPKLWLHVDFLTD